MLAHSVVLTAGFFHVVPIRNDTVLNGIPQRHVRGSFSARVPRSSFAKVRRVLVSHIEEEGEEQENEKEDEREKMESKE